MIKRMLMAGILFLPIIMLCLTVMMGVQSHYQTVADRKLKAAIHDLETVKPSNLVPPCTVGRVVRFLSDSYPFQVTIKDSQGHRLDVYSSDGKLSFGSDLSTAGDHEEQILLKILKDGFQKLYNPALETDPRFPDVPGNEDVCDKQSELE